MNRVLTIGRDARFSPNSAEKDRAIMEAVIGHLNAEVVFVSEAELADVSGYDVILSMGRLPRTLQMLNDAETQGCQVINRPAAVERCNRHYLMRLMRHLGLPEAPFDPQKGCWLKRGDGSSQGENDVVFCPDNSSLESAKRQFASRGITDYVISPHIEGDEVKFYAVGETFFRWYYPTLSDHQKFLYEGSNTAVRHTPFSVKMLQSNASRLAEAIGISVYGGDAIIDEQGRAFIIDFNDWPSFGLCRDEAALEIAKLTAL